MDMNLSELQEIVNREDWHGAVNRIAKNWRKLSAEQEQIRFYPKEMTIIDSLPCTTWSNFVPNILMLFLSLTIYSIFSYLLFLESAIVSFRFLY